METTRKRNADVRAFKISEEPLRVGTKFYGFLSAFVKFTQPNCTIDKKSLPSERKVRLLRYSLVEYELELSK